MVAKRKRINTAIFDGLGQQAGTVLDTADLSSSQVSITPSGTFDQQLSHPSIFGQSVALGSTPVPADGNYIVDFAETVSVTADDVITLWVWQEYPSGSANATDYPFFTGEQAIAIYIRSAGNGGTAQYLSASPWSRMRGWTAIQLDLSAASRPTIKGIMNTPVVGGADDDFLTNGIDRIQIQMRVMTEKYSEMETPFVYGGMVLNQKRNAYFMPYFDDGYKYIIDPESGYSPAVNTLEYMSSLGQVGTCGIIADRILSSSFHYMSPRDIHDLYEAGWDIGVHSGYYWGKRTDGADEIKQTYYTLTSSGTTATLQTAYSWMRNPVADGSQLVVNSADVGGYVGTYTATRVDDRTVTFTLASTVSDAAATTFNIESSWGAVAFSTQAEREAAKAAVKADIEYNLAFLQNPYTKLTAAGFTGIDYLIGVDWTNGNPSSVLPANAWHSSGSDWAYILQAALDELGINSAGTSNPIMESSKTFSAGNGGDHYPTDFFVARTTIENTNWLPESASSFNGSVLSTAEKVVADVIPATFRQGGTFAPYIHSLTDDPATIGDTSYNRNDWHGVCAAASTNGLRPITAREYARRQRVAGDDAVSFKGTENLSGLSVTEIDAITNFRRRLQRMGYWGSLKGLWIPALSGDNAKLNIITGVAVVDTQVGTGTTITWESDGVQFAEGSYGNYNALETDVNIGDESNYSFGAYVKTYTETSVAWVVGGIMGATEPEDDSFINDMYAIVHANPATDADKGLKTYHGALAVERIGNYLIPDNTLLSARRRNGTSTNTESSAGNLTTSADVTATPSTETFRLGHSGSKWDTAATWRGQVFYVGEGVAHNHILMESAIEMLISDLGV